MRLLIVAAVLWLTPWLANAQQHWSPTQPVRFVLGQAAGGGADTIGRSIARGLSERLGQPVVVENRPGANGGVAAEAVLRAPADGQSVMLIFTSLTINPAVYTKVSYDPATDFRHLGAVCQLPLVMMATLSIGASNAAHLVAAAKARPDAFFAASSGNGSFSHLVLEMLNRRAGIRLTHVPFKGEASAVQQILSNQGQMVYLGTPTLAISNARAGKLKLLGVTTAGRIEQLPEVPTLAEQGLGDFDESFWYGVALAAGTPNHIAQVYERHVADISRSEETIRTNAKFGCIPLQLRGPEFSARVKSDLAKYGAIARSVGMKLD